MKLGAWPGDQKVSQSLERNWEWDQVIRKCPHPSNKTGSETRWSECVHISKTKLGVRPGDQEVSTSLKTKLGARPGDQEVSTSVKRNREWDKVIRKCPNLSNETGSETWWSESVQISRTKLGVRSGYEKVSQSLKWIWEWRETIKRASMWL